MNSGVLERLEPRVNERYSNHLLLLTEQPVLKLKKHLIISVVQNAQIILDKITDNINKMYLDRR